MRGWQELGDVELVIRRPSFLLAPNESSTHNSVRNVLQQVLIDLERGSGDAFASAFTDDGDVILL